MSEARVKSQAASIFLKAADYIRQYGWQKEGMNEDGKPRCSMGALSSAHPAVEWDRQLADVMYKTLYKELDGISLTQYNAKVNDGEKVAQLYEKTARKLKYETLTKART